MDIIYNDRAPIVSLEDIQEMRHTLGKVVVTGGGYDPIHSGHISCIQESKKFGDTLVVIVNGDWFLREKKGKAFQDLKTRSIIVSALRGVDYVVPYETTKELGVQGVLEALKPDIYTKGGDKNPENIRDWNYCKENNIQIIMGVGGDVKNISSSFFLDEWERFVLKKMKS